MEALLSSSAWAAEKGPYFVRNKAQSGDPERERDGGRKGGREREGVMLERERERGKLRGPPLPLFSSTEDEPPFQKNRGLVC